VATEIIEVFIGFFNATLWYNLLVMKEIVILPCDAGQKAEKFVRKYLGDAPLGFIFKAFRKKDIKANGHWIPKDYVLQAGDVVRLYVTDQQLEDFKHPRLAEKKPFPYGIAYEDDNVLIVDKPSGLLVYGDEKEKRNTLTQKVLDYLYFKDQFDPVNHAFVPSPAHRLDRNTSGLVIFAKTDAALKDLETLFKDREDISKKYLALVDGIVEQGGLIEKPLKKNSESGLVTVTPLSEGGKEAKTSYEPIKRFAHSTLIECVLYTGRTHQIRVHLASIGHPILGDGKYGNYLDNRKFRSLYGLDYQFLRAHEITFGKLSGVLSPLSGKTFVSALNTEEQAILDKLGKEDL